VPQVFPKPRTNPLTVPRSSESPGQRARIHSLNPSRRIFDAPAPLRLWHLASLDAPTVAVVWTLGFAWAADVRLPRWVPLLLALTAWAVYIADRLLDARSALRTEPHQLRERHFFHWRFRRIFVPLGAAAACAAAWLVLARMPATVRERNSVLAAAALLYFISVHSRRIRRRLPAAVVSKEMLVGVLFTAACALPAWYCGRIAGIDRPVGPLLGPVALFALLAWLNCHLIERWETAAELWSGARLALALAVAAAALTAALAVAGQPAAAALAASGAASALLLALLDRLRARLTPVALRAAADLVLLTPLLLLALPAR
jgi:hypothetical protein